MLGELMSLTQRLVGVLIRHAQRTPYFHLLGYMERYWLLKPRWWTLGCAIRLHRILRSDEDRALHDHPWAFVTIILRGGYAEERPILEQHPVHTEREPTVTRRHGPGAVLFRGARSRHRLVLPRWSDAWTLFIMGPKVQEWGFYTRHGKYSWHDYLPSPAATYQREQIALHHGAE